MTGLNTLVKRYPGVQLATLVDAPPAGPEWVHEIKFDGYRLLAFVAAREPRLLTRNGKDWTPKFPSIAAALAALPVSDAVLDLEAVVLDAAGKSSFQDLQAALGGGAAAKKIVGYVFDLLHLEGEDLTSQPLTERKRRLKALLKSNHTLRYSDHVEGQGDEMFRNACEKGLEGIVSKVAVAPYVAGRQQSWLKTKCTLRQEFVIIGYSDARSGGRALGALYLGYRKDGGLQYAGKVGTGFSMQSAGELQKRLTAIAQEPPVLGRAETKGVGAGEWQAVHWVNPVLLAEVSFTEWTSDGRIRHPSFQGLREDKPASQVKRETAAKKKR